MISVDTEISDRFGWRLPCPAMLERLLRSTRGRVLRSDQDFPERPEGVTTGEWADFRKSVLSDQGSLFTEYYLRDKDAGR